MKLTSSWIREWLGRTIISDHDIVAALAQAGMEIEQVTYSKPIDNNVVVCSVKKVVQHPQADRLKLVTVETDAASFAVVCGAPNVRPGIKVPLAQIGAVLPSGDTITRATLRGEVSEGMLCSARELGIGQDHEGILELADDVPVGTPLSELFPADTQIDVKTPANRFDVQSVLGLSRDVAAITGAPLRDLPNRPLPVSRSEAGVIAAQPAAKRLSYIKIKLGKRADAASPRWMQARLQAAGMRPVNLIVDITNFVMLDVGQPLHAYDAGRVELPFWVRPARVQESFTALDGVERVLSPADLVVTDRQGIVGLAGVMGGQFSEVSAETSEIWLEAGVFDSISIRKTAQRYGLRTEASARFERGVPVDLPTLGLARALALFTELAGAKVLAEAWAGELTSSPRRIKLDLGELTKIASFEIEPAEVNQILRRLQFDVVQSSKTLLSVVAPWWRPDVQRSIDLIEEIVRVLGYERVPSKIPVWRPVDLRFDQRRATRRLIRDTMYAAGLFEVMTYSFVAADQLAELSLHGADHLKLENPLSSEQAYLRSGLLASHLSVAERNRKYSRQFGFYELSNVFIKRDEDALPDEPYRLAMMMVQPVEAYRQLKGVLDLLGRGLGVGFEVTPETHQLFAPGRLGRIMLRGRNIGSLGQLHPTLVRTHKLAGEAAYLEIDVEPLFKAAGAPQFHDLPRFPVIVRDLSVWMKDGIYWSEVHKALRAFDVGFVEEYTGELAPSGSHGLTLRVTVRHEERTPTEAEADATVRAVFDCLQRQFGALSRDS